MFDAAVARNFLVGAQHSIRYHNHHPRRARSRDPSVTHQFRVVPGTQFNLLCPCFFELQVASFDLQRVRAGALGTNVQRNLIGDRRICRHFEIKCPVSSQFQVINSAR